MVFRVERVGLSRECLWRHRLEPGELPHNRHAAVVFDRRAVWLQNFQRDP